VLPFAKGLSEQAVKGAYEWLEDQGVNLGRTFWQRITGRGGDEEELVSRLSTYVEADRDAASRLTAAAIAEAGQRARTDEEFLEVLVSFLMTIFRLVDQLQRPAVLPGFLTGADDLAIVDVRTRKANEKPAKPALRSPAADSPRIEMAVRGLPYNSPSIPRIWIVSEGREELEELEQRAESSTPFFDYPNDFGNFMEGRPLVSAITREEVWLEDSRTGPQGVFVPEQRNINPVPWAQTPDGVISMHRALLGQVGEKEAKRDVWITAWKEALGRGPDDR
jgi:hypothetical protein